jgi:hypothetical protein
VQFLFGTDENLRAFVLGVFGVCLGGESTQTEEIVESVEIGDKEEVPSIHAVFRISQEVSRITKRAG